MTMDTLPKNDPRLERILIDSEKIDARVNELAKQICADYAGEVDLCLVGVLKGAAVFMMDLARALCRAGMPGITFAFVKASTYGDSIKSEGENSRHVKMDFLGAKIRSKNILLIDDILDQGYTLGAIKNRLAEDYPDASVKTCVFLTKILGNPSDEARTLRSNFNVDYSGFAVEDRWVVGYGLDAGELYRELPYVAIAKEEYFI